MPDATAKLRCEECDATFDASASAGSRYRLCSDCWESYRSWCGADRYVSVPRDRLLVWLGRLALLTCFAVGVLCGLLLARFW